MSFDRVLVTLFKNRLGYCCPEKNNEQENEMRWIKSNYVQDLIAIFRILWGVVAVISILAMMLGYLMLTIVVFRMTIVGGFVMSVVAWLLLPPVIKLLAWCNPPY